MLAVGLITSFPFFQVELCQLGQTTLDIFGLTFTILHRKVVKAQLKIIKFPSMSQVSHLLHPWKSTWNTTVKLWFRWFSFSIWVIFRRPSRSTLPGRKQAPKCWVISVEFWCWSWGNHLIWSWSWVIWFEWYPNFLMWFLCLKISCWIVGSS